MITGARHEWRVCLSWLSFEGPRMSAECGRGTDRWWKVVFSWVVCDPDYGDDFVRTYKMCAMCTRQIGKCHSFIRNVLCTHKIWNDCTIIDDVSTALGTWSTGTSYCWSFQCPRHLCGERRNWYQISVCVIPVVNFNAVVVSNKCTVSEWTLGANQRIPAPRKTFTRNSLSREPQ